MSTWTVLQNSCFSPNPYLPPTPIFPVSKDSTIIHQGAQAKRNHHWVPPFVTWHSAMSCLLSHFSNLPRFMPPLKVLTQATVIVSDKASMLPLLPPWEYTHTVYSPGKHYSPHLIIWFPFHNPPVAFHFNLIKCTLSTTVFNDQHPPNYLPIYVLLSSNTPSSFPSKAHYTFPTDSHVAASTSTFELSLTHLPQGCSPLILKLCRCLYPQIYWTSRNLP